MIGRLIKALAGIRNTGHTETTGPVYRFYEGRIEDRERQARRLRGVLRDSVAVAAAIRGSDSVAWSRIFHIVRHVRLNVLTARDRRLIIEDHLDRACQVCGWVEHGPDCPVRDPEPCKVEILGNDGRWYRLEEFNARTRETR